MTWVQSASISTDEGSSTLTPGIWQNAVRLDLRERADWHPRSCHFCQLPPEPKHWWAAYSSTSRLDWYALGWTVMSKYDHQGCIEWSSPGMTMPWLVHIYFTVVGAYMSILQRNLDWWMTIDAECIDQSRWQLGCALSWSPQLGHWTQKTRLFHKHGSW